MSTNPLSYDISDYTPYGLMGKDPHSVRQEYIRLRRVAQKRLARMKEAGFSGMQAYKWNVNAYERSSELSDADLRIRLSELADFIVSKGSTVTGIRQAQKQMINTLQQHGYEGINKSNIGDFGRFMEKYRASNLDKIYDSKRVAKMFSEAKRGKAVTGSKILLKAFRDFMEDQRT